MNGQPRATRRQERVAALAAWLALANSIGDAIDERCAQCCKFMLILMLAVSTALSFLGFFHGPLADVALDMEAAKWVYMGVAIALAASLALYERVGRLRTYVFAHSAVVFSVSLVLLDYHAELGIKVVLATLTVVVLTRFLDFLASGGGR